mmetsp:Transcript_35225/g.34889  ORF Transcript_35225/g.34889 Transcript_35225/m.34889 type:complete len:112 (-) Transcript_35225:86-421(-)
MIIPMIRGIKLSGTPRTCIVPTKNRPTTAISMLRYTKKFKFFFSLGILLKTTDTPIYPTKSRAKMRPAYDGFIPKSISLNCKTGSLKVSCRRLKTTMELIITTLKFLRHSR